MSDLLNKASLVMVPSGYKEDTVYSVVPSDGSGDLSFTRASNGTRINSAGLVEVVPWNLCDYSEDQTQWTSQNQTTVIANSTTAPNGTTTADTVTPTAVNDDHYRGIILGQQVGALTAFIYVKPNGYNFLDWGIWNGSQYIVRATFDLVNLTYTFTNAGTATIESVGNGWLKCGISGTNASLTTMSLYYRSRPTGGTGAFTGNGTSGAYIWGAQLNIGSTAKPYFPTTDRLNVPRLTYQNGGGGCPSLLLEKQSTNVLLYSSTSDWGASGTITKTYNTTDLVSPDGTNNATKVVSSAGTGDTSVGFSVPDGAVTVSFWGRVASGTKTLVVDVRNNSSAVASGSPVLTTEWQRFTVTNTTGGTGSSGAVWIYPNGAGTFYIWGVQAEAGSYATSTILTNGSSATRVADASNTGVSSSILPQASGTIFVQFDWQKAQVDSNIISVHNNSNNLAWITKNSTTQLFGTFFMSGYIGTIQPTISASSGVIKVAYAWTNGSQTMFVNGVEVGTATGTITSSPTFNALQFNGFWGINKDGCEIQEAVLFTTKLTNAELASLTTI